MSFGSGRPFSVGLEEELLLVDPETHGLVHEAERLLPRMGVPEERAGYEAFAAEIELRSRPHETPEAAASELRELRGVARGAGATLLGMGLHPTADHGDVRITDHERYRRVDDTMRGLIRRTPECALHVHVGMPDEQAAVNAHNALRCLLPLLQGLAANSPFWFGTDSGLASARYAMTRAYPRRGVPRPLRDLEEWEEVTSAAVAAGGLDDYTSLWWDVRPQPRLGTVEMREMDVQADLGHSAALAALVQARGGARRRAPALHAAVGGARGVELPRRARRAGARRSCTRARSCRWWRRPGRPCATACRRLVSWAATPPWRRSVGSWPTAARRTAAGAPTSGAGMPEVLAEAVADTAA